MPQHQYHKRCAHTTRCTAQFTYTCLCLLVVYVLCLAWSAVPLQQRQPSLAGCADKSWSRRQRALGELDELEQQPGRRIHPHLLAARRAGFLWEKASAAEPVVRPGEGVHRANYKLTLMLPERQLQQCQRRQVSVQQPSGRGGAPMCGAAVALIPHAAGWRPREGRARAAPPTRRA